jgi:hypothetical protein
VGFHLPDTPKVQYWERILDTGAAEPMDICESGKGLPLKPGDRIILLDRSLALLLAH